jgi:hypothetical protein
MTKEQKLKLIELVQEHFEDIDEEAIRTYGYTIPMDDFRNIFSKALFDKPYNKSARFVIGAHCSCRPVCILTDEELVEAGKEFKMLLDSKAFSFTKSKRAIRVSKTVVFYRK